MPLFISKLVWFFTQPSSLIVMALLAGLFLSTRTKFTAAGRRLTWLGIIGLLVGGLSPLANIVMFPLEDRFAVPPLKAGSRTFSGIIVLGGAESPDISAARGQLALNEAAERITEGARLAHLLTSPRLVFTGSAAGFIFEGSSAAEAVGNYWRSIGISGSRIILESKSKTTWENAVLTHQMLKPTAGQRFLLVTTAHHMPRAMGAFRRAGFDVVAYPVDFRTTGPAHAFRFFDSIPSGLRRLDDAAREWAGLVAYRVTDRSAALLPAP